MKKIIFGALLTLSLAATASAAILPPPTGQCASQRGSTTLDNLLSTNGCISSDKIFSDFGTLGILGVNDIPGAWNVDVRDLGNDVHRVDFIQCATCGSLTDPAGGGPTSYGIQYVIQVDLVNYPYKVINTITVSQNSSADGSPASTLIQKWVYGMDGFLLTPISQWPLQTAGSETSNLPNLSPAVTYARVVELITLNNASTTAFTDTFYQTTIPEPATYGMMGLGLAALGLLARRKKA